MEIQDLLWYGVLGSITGAAKRHNVTKHSRLMIITCTIVRIWLVAYVTKDLRENNLINIAPRFGSDLDGTIEKRPRHSTAMVRVYSIEARSKMA